VKVRFNALVDIIGYKGRVNVDKDGNPKIVADGEPSMAPENNTDTFEQAFKNSADLLDELTDELTKMKEVREQALSNIISETQAAQITRDKVSQTTKELEQAQQELRSVQEVSLLRLAPL
jgi:hypothetical protein